MEFADDAVEALGRIMGAVSEGQISPGEAAAMATLISTTLADLLTPPVVANPFSTMRASLRR
jgi:hypothetical protein